MTTTVQKGAAFAALHRRPQAFIIPNPFDIGTTRILTRLGFEALATTSAGYAFSIGKQDNKVGRAQMIHHIAEMVGTTDLPVSADLESGFGDAPETVAETIRLAGMTGLVGGSIEDSTQHPDQPQYEIALAAERIRAAVEAARALPHTFTLTARAENYFVGNTDIGDTIRRLQAYQEAGADVLYAPAVTRKEDIVSIVASVDRPVNVLMGLPGVNLDLTSLSAMGVKRVSVGVSLTCAAYGAFVSAAREMRDTGTFSFANHAATYSEISRMIGS